MNTYFDIHSHHVGKLPASRTIVNVNSDFNRLPDYEFLSVGLHPWHLQASTAEAAFHNLKTAVQQTNIIAIGECGLDKACETDFELQSHYFNLQLDLAVETGKPLIIHCVRAFEETLQLLNQRINGKVPVIFHGFTKNQSTADRILSCGYYLSFGKHLADEKTTAVFLQCPINRIFLETDNSQLPISTIYQLAAEAKGISIDLLYREILNNVQRVFGDRIFTAHE